MEKNDKWDFLGLKTPWKARVGLNKNFFFKKENFTALFYG